MLRCQLIFTTAHEQISISKIYLSLLTLKSTSTRYYVSEVSSKMTLAPYLAAYILTRRSTVCTFSNGYFTCSNQKNTAVAIQLVTFITKSHCNEVFLASSNFAYFLNPSHPKFCTRSLKLGFTIVFLYSILFFHNNR